MILLANLLVDHVGPLAAARDDVRDADLLLAPRDG